MSMQTLSYMKCSLDWNSTGANPKGGPGTIKLSNYVIITAQPLGRSEALPLS